MGGDMEYIVYEQVEKKQLIFSGKATYFGILDNQRYPISKSVYDAHMAYYEREWQRRVNPNKVLENTK